MESREFFKRILHQHPFFRDMPEDYLATLAGCASNVRFKPGSRVFQRGTPADSFYILRTGRIAIDIESPERGDITIATLGEGEVVGWSWLFPPYEWHHDARAVEDTRAIALDGKCLRGKCEADPALGYELMKRFSAMVIDRLK
ncbi:MAG TPA: cyclic nucleotide-binding domain-containing protein, partial [Sedimenticola sp.]|nr:cyclic nucleotide-binding domain-containing protein [Sedimenticola sp.]